MNVTKHVLKGRQLHNEGCLGMVPAEQGEYPKASNHERITENNDFIMDMQTGGLLERILDRDNMNNAYLRVKSNKGVGGVDKMSVDELLPYLKENKDKLLEQLRLGKYKPQPVRRVEIPKEEKGKVRKLGIPTVVDRVIQQAIMQVPCFAPDSDSWRRITSRSYIFWSISGSKPELPGHIQPREPAIVTEPSSTVSFCSAYMQQGSISLTFEIEPHQ